ncbi:class I SAM-dependent methyltransferase [Paenibacillus senegalensis]|uniref:class I SAM-dependent methyltransferase n=1 Tax=Paenibacillus senegalensis TaxID=1465766 RepID=UPI00028A36DB|nr:SAM-dependent methyltransferase [Paenibacillus senegalensis]
MIESNSSNRIVPWIALAIRETAAKAVTFCEYMNWCLYHPEFGYYMNTRPKVGKEGDFYTSSSITPVMGEMLANRIKAWADEDSRSSACTVTEWGAGTGKLARALLDKLARAWPDLYERLEYWIIEKSEYHRQLLLQELAAHSGKIRMWREDEWSQQPCPERMFMFSNELLDAFPVHRVRQNHGRLMESWVAWDEDSQALTERWEPCSNNQLYHYLQADSIELKESQEAEINLLAERWVRQAAEWLSPGSCLLTIDYGDLAAEIYAPHRMKGTLMCYYRHEAQDNPLIYPGEQDITSHVNFSACMRAGRLGGMVTEQWTTQKQFLVEQGILNELQNHASRDPFSPVARKNRAIRQLLLSDGMSELFKVLIQRKL